MALTKEQLDAMVGSSLNPNESAAALGSVNSGLSAMLSAGKTPAQDNQPQSLAQTAAQPAASPIMQGDGIQKATGQIKDAFQGGVDEMKAGFQQQKTGTGFFDPLEAGLKVGSGAVSAVTSPLAPLAAPIQEGVNKISDKISDNPAVQKFAVSPAGEATSRIAGDVSDLDNLAGAAAGLEGGGGLAKPVLRAGGEALIKSGEESALANHENFVRGLVTPEQTVKTATKEIQQGRVQEGGMAFKGRQVEPTMQDNSVINTVKGIPEVHSGNTILQNVNAVHNSIGSTAMDLRTQLRNSPVIFPKKEVMAFIDKAKDTLSENPMLVGDAEKTASKMLDKFKQLVTKHPGNGEGLLDARQEFDNWIKSQRGENVFDPSRESAVSVALKTIRQGANDFLANKTPDVPVKQLLGKQTDMYNAIEAMAPKAAKEAETKLGRLVQKGGNMVGVKNKVVQEIGAAVGLAGFGAAAYFAPSAAALAGVGGLGYGIYKGITNPALRTGLGKAMTKTAEVLPMKENPAVLNMIKNPKK